MMSAPGALKILPVEGRRRSVSGRARLSGSSVMVRPGMLGFMAGESPFQGCDDIALLTPTLVNLLGKNSVKYLIWYVRLASV